MPPALAWPKLPAWHQRAWWRAFLADLRPAMVGVKVVASGVRIRWLLPMAAIGFSLQAALLVVALAALLPPRAWGGRLARFPLRTNAAALWGWVLDPTWMAALRLPPGEPYVEVEVGDGVQVRIASV
jgi:hypothetical protein